MHQDRSISIMSQTCKHPCPRCFNSLTTRDERCSECGHEATGQLSVKGSSNLVDEEEHGRDNSRYRIDYHGFESTFRFLVKILHDLCAFVVHFFSTDEIRLIRIAYPIWMFNNDQIMSSYFR